MSVEEQLAWEARQRPRAAAAAILAGILMIGSLVAGGLAGRNQPPALLLDSLRNLEKPGPIGPMTSVRVASFDYLNAHPLIVLLAVFIGLGLLASAYPLYVLARAVAARRALPRPAIPAALAGCTLVALALIVTAILQVVFLANKLDGPHTLDAFGSTSPTNSPAFALAAFVGLFAFALGVIMISLNGMRAGLLTRTMGILGMAAGGFTVVTLNPSEPLFPLWVAFLAPLFLGRWMGGQPPAWQTGKEEPWPTSQQLREQRSRAQGNLAEPDPEAVEERAQAVARPHPSSKKRKRKRRT